ncbi:MAG: hypothetical protein WD648_03960 [Planctomycetaceae bacterium]
MEFDERLERAIGRGERARAAKGRQQADKTLSEEDLKNNHLKARLDLSEHIEACLRKLADYFPGFRFQTLVGEDGWGAKISRDDFQGGRREAENRYSRIELVVRPFRSTPIVEVAGKATVRNKEIFHRNHFQFLSDLDLESFRELIDLWVLEYAEKFAAEN